MPPQEQCPSVATFRDAKTLAMLTSTKIVLKESLPELDLQGFQFQSRTAGDEISAPLFVALHLARLSLCEVQCPSWLDPDHLNEILMKEMESESTFSSGLPIYYYEIFQALDAALIPAARICRSVITRIYLTRCQKIRSRKIMDFQFVGSAEVRFCRMIIMGCPSTTCDD